MFKRYKTLLNITALGLWLILTSSIWAQTSSGSQFLDARRFEAWTVEYQPYRLLIENAVSEYITLTKADIPPISPSDLVIAIRPKGDKKKLYQLRYGTPAEGFTIIPKQKIPWVLGATLSRTIAEREKYYNLDSRLPFETQAHRPEIDYILNESFWTQSDFLIGLDKMVYRFGSGGGLLVEWGNELIGRPYAEAGFARLGMVTPVFKLGVQVPTVSITNGYRATKDNQTWRKLSGGIGGFGAFQFQNLYGEMFFQTMDAAFAPDSRYINYLDLGGLLSLSFNTALSGVEVGSYRLFAGGLQIKVGAVVGRVAHRQLLNGKVVFQDIKRDTVGLPEEDKTYGGSDSIEDSGIFFRLDYASTLIDRLYPRHQLSVQLAGPSFLMKYTYAFNPNFALPITIVTYTKDNEWTPSFAVFVGAQFRLKQR